MKTLTIEHIAPYLPYGLYFKVSQAYKGEWEGFATDCDFTTKQVRIKGKELKWTYQPLANIKPALVPLDKLTDAQYAEVGRIILGSFPDNVENIDAGKLWCTAKENPTNFRPYISLEESVELTAYLHGIKADVYNLIPKNLAISAYDLPENPYDK